MIKVRGDFENIKAEMKEAHLKVSGQIRGLKAEHRTKDKHAPYPAHVENKLGELASNQDMYRVSKVLPVRVEGVVINYKLYSAFIKKLKGFNVKVVALPDGVVLNYWKPGTLYHGKGVLKLYDLSIYFKDFTHIPNAELVDDAS